MTIKNSGLTAGGRAHPEIRPGDKWKDSRGNLVIIESYRSDGVIFCREGYASPCICSPERLTREFTFVSSAPNTDGKDIDRIMRVQGIERIRVMREIIRERGNRK
ncbi:DUF4222 domain-containing protein [Enterobacter dykesii]|uniref:DUF4222 domain-containing protein n=1 Tax=Enterobacter dykesii TaxID=2797506 RepID=UPI0032B4D493